MTNIVELPIHFDTDNHWMKAGDFLAFTKDLEKIGKDFSKNIFGKKVVLQMYVLPPEEGSFLGRWGITLLIGGGIWQGLETDIAKAFVKGLTGNEPSYYAEQLGSETRKGALLIRDATQGFLEKIDTGVVVPVMQFEIAYEAKTDFYKKCLENPEIKGIGFSEEHEFPVKRKDFIGQILKPEENNSDLKPDYEIHQLLIASSVNTLDSHAQWRLQDTQTKTFLYAYLKDIKFQEKFFSGDFPLKLTENDDIIIAMVEYKKQLREGEIKITERNIIKVYKFNNITVEDLPEGGIIAAVDRIKAGVSSRQSSLLDSIQLRQR